MKKVMSIFILLFVHQALSQEVFVEKSGCQISDYVLGDAQSSVNFMGSSYTPKCLKILVGSQVSMAASKKHPLFPQSSSDGNPIRPTESTELFSFNELGTFGYYCDKHGNSSGQGMAGSIWVVDEL